MRKNKLPYPSRRSTPATFHFLLKPFFTAITLLLSMQVSYSQLDSVSVEIEFINASDSLGEYPYGALKVHVHLNDLQYFSKVSTDVYETAGNHYVGSIVMTKAEIISQGLDDGNGFTLVFENLSEIGYKIETTLQDQHSAYYPPVTQLFNPY